MPIYAYRCDECGFAKDVLQKMSEDPLTVCPECNQTSFKKQVTAAGFQLKGSGWYVTDFRNGAGNAAATGVSAKNEDKTGESKTSDAPSSAAPAVSASSTDSGTAVSTSSASSSAGSSDNKAA
jgi:putative FmdB family regulatory protein